MGATELNSLVRRWRRGAALGALVAGLAVTVALHHGGLEGHGPDAAVVCLAVVGAVLLVAAPTAPRPRPVPRARSLVSERGPRPLRRPAAAARDGPATLQVFLS
jgi:peptidoglycan/LPS O-acetylase OafA/YrhL